jgi:hypothetical protein
MLKLGNTYLNFGGTYLTSWKANDNPLNLPANTIRLRFKDNVTPSFPRGTYVQVSQSPNVWDLTLNSSSWRRTIK